MVKSAKPPLQAIDVVLIAVATRGNGCGTIILVVVIHPLLSVMVKLLIPPVAADAPAPM